MGSYLRGGRLFYLEKTTVSVLQKELEYKVETIIINFLPLKRGCAY